MTHLGKRISALVDGELGHDARDRALVHVAHCAQCREQLSAERGLKERLAGVSDPVLPAQLLHTLLAMGDPRGNAAAQHRPPPPLASLLPPMPAAGRGTWLRRPGGRTDLRRPDGVTMRRRRRYAAAGAVSAAVLMLGVAFVAGGSAGSSAVPVVPPAAQFSVEHAATTAGLPLSDTAFNAVTAGGGLPFPSTAVPVPAR